MKVDVLLEKIIGIPSFTMEETAMSLFLESYCKQKGYKIFRDEWGNVFVTKGETVGFYPCVTSHLDTVFPIPPASIHVYNNRLYGLDKNGDRSGVGGDDKTGAWICLKLLEQFKVLKAAFYVGEESMMYGSTRSSNEFFKDVGYCIAFDCPSGNIIGYSSQGVRLFENSGPFTDTAWGILSKRGYDKMQDHPYTDILRIKERNGFQTMNIGSGYYNLHSSQELIHLEEMENCLAAGTEIIANLGQKYYAYLNKNSTPPIPVTQSVPTDFYDCESLMSLSHGTIQTMRKNNVHSLQQLYEIGQHSPHKAAEFHRDALSEQTKELKRMKKWAKTKTFCE